MKPPTIADQFEHRSINELIPNVRNPRSHSAQQVSQIAASIVEYGYTNPVLMTPPVSLLPAMPASWQHAKLAWIEFR